MNKILEAARALVEMIEKEKSESKVCLADIPVGGRFKTGIGEFVVLEQEAGLTKVITSGVYKARVKFDDESTDYKTSCLRKLCDGEIFTEFSGEFGEENIISNEADLTTVDMQHEFGALPCKVRPLTFDEARKYNELLVDKELDSFYWTCTPWSTEERGWNYSVAVVAPSGYIRSVDYGLSCGVRPFCILKSDLFVSLVED